MKIKIRSLSLCKLLPADFGDIVKTEPISQSRNRPGTEVFAVLSLKTVLYLIGGVPLGPSGFN